MYVRWQNINLYFVLSQKITFPHQSQKHSRQQKYCSFIQQSAMNPSYLHFQFDPFQIKVFKFNYSCLLIQLTFENPLIHHFKLQLSLNITNKFIVIMSNQTEAGVKHQQKAQSHKQQVASHPEKSSVEPHQKVQSVITQPNVTQHNGQPKIGSENVINKPQTNNSQVIHQHIEQYLSTHKILLTQVQFKQFIEKEQHLNRPFQSKNFQEWIKLNKKQEHTLKAAQNDKKQIKQNQKPQTEHKKQTSEPQKPQGEHIKQTKELQKPETEHKKQINKNQQKQSEPKKQIKQNQKPQIENKKLTNEHQKPQREHMKQTSEAQKPQGEHTKQTKEYQKPQNQHKKQKNTHEKQVTQKKLDVQKNIQKQLSEQEIINLFFAQKQIKQIKSKVINAVNSKIITKLPLTQEIILKYLKQTPQNRSLQHFKEWYKKEQQIQLASFLEHYNQSESSKQIRSHIKKMQQIIQMATNVKNNLNIHFNVGQSKGKTALKFGLELKQVAKTKFNIVIEIKIKRKSELKQYIQNLIKKKQKLAQYNFWKLIKIHFTELQKSLRIQIQSKFFEELILHEFIQKVQKRFSQSQKPVLKLEGEIAIKNSIRLDEASLQNKKFVKWVGEGFSKTLKVQANSKLIQHFTKPFAQFFPIFKVIKSGEITLKLKQVQNIDKLFDRLGINEICQETPTLRDYISVLLKEHLDSTVVLWVGDILIRSLIFSCTIPNERISFQVDINVSHLNINLSLGSQACKQLGELLSKISKENFD